MELSFGPEYESFREEVRDFITTHKDQQAPSSAGSEAGKSWQKTLIEAG